MTMTRREEIARVFSDFVNRLDEIKTPVETGELVKRLNGPVGKLTEQNIRDAASLITQQEAEIARLREERDEAVKALAECYDFKDAMPATALKFQLVMKKVRALLSQKDEGQ